MRKLKKFLLSALLIGTTSTAYAEYWLLASLKHSEFLGTGNYMKCFYETYSGMSFSMVKKGISCPMVVHYNPETNQVTESLE